MNVQQELEELMLTYEGVCAIFITDHDGGLILNIGLPSTLDNSRFRQQLIVSHVTTIPQIHKLDMGGHQTTFALYESHQIAVHSIDKYYFIVHAGTNTNTGAMLSLREKLFPIGSHMMSLCPPIDGDALLPPPSYPSAAAPPPDFD
ncbi:Late endosomal/lysosomal adaptor and MAPK and MTOR activator 5 [Caenorhabditis elegans]|uniref:Late endosomal/lysosomal adaptor and MAPK and MTOR activator 5 n=2 Tax=Caenorhabditis elegans TaxID=6239 RepID=Q8WQG5_CAEEL|nr:Late endosomal/lysosomal adaptor and MAPK and MTOR activator 5 [Caenorhabditis elegans]CAD21698.1 Late endosomal/lysosomal adaptor and MAPK and MTOR activator 5 [Caenorhabditis elegans]|eukprot:NP_741627.1 Late endosomal/lysosomal adaptor, Mapk (MAPK) and mToR (MTOR) activator homolog [Caenorhabditis elegans]